MPAVKIADLCPWDLTLELAGRKLATLPPTWGQVLELAKLEELMKSAPDGAVLQERLVKALDGFLQERDRLAGSGLELAWDDLVAAFTVASEYFGGWLKKKQEAARAAARVALGEDAKASPASPASGR